MTAIHSDERGAINRSFWLIVILLALLGVTIIDGSSILFSRMQLSDVADAVASDAAAACNTSHDANAALAAGQQTLNDRDPDASIITDPKDPNTFKMDPKTCQVTLTLQKTVSTVVVGKISALKDFAHIEETSTSGPPAI